MKHPGTLETLSDEDSETLKSAIVKARRRLGPLLALMFATSILDRANVGFAKDALRTDVHIGDAAYALGAGIFFIGYALFEVPSNLMLHRVGAKIWLSRIMVTWGIASAFMMFVQGPHSFYALRFLLGLAEAGFSPGVILYSTYWFPSRERGKFLGIYYMGLPAALTVGSALSGLIMQRMSGYQSLRNWQWMFLLEGLAASLVGVAAYFALPSKPSQASWLTPEERDELTAAVQTDVDASEKHGPENSFTALRDAKVFLFVLIYFAIQVGIYGVIFYLPSRIASLVGPGLDTRVGLLTAIPWLCAFVGLRAITGWADKLRKHGQFAMWLLLLSAVGLFASTQALQLSSVILAFSLATVGFVIVQPIFWTLPAAYLRGTAAATGIAVIGACGNLGGFVAPTMKTAAEASFHSASAGTLLLALVTLSGSALLGVHCLRSRSK